MSANIDIILQYGHHLATLNIGRGASVYEAGNFGPMWAANGSVPSDEIIKKQGAVCVGLLALLVRRVGGSLPFLNNVPSIFAKHPELLGLEGAVWGIGGTDEWMYLFQNQLQRLDVAKAYPKGTLLLRVWNPFDQGHVSILAEDADEGTLMDSKVIQTAGSPVGLDRITDFERVRDQHEYYLRNPQSNIPPMTLPWDTTSEFTVRFDGPYYTHVLLPQYWVPNYNHNALRF